jgi:hypothetical protein
MNHGPFGLSPQVFSIGFLVLWLTVIPLLSLVVGRNKRKRMLAATAESYQAQQMPGAHPWGDLMGVWHFKSAARWAGVICGYEPHFRRTWFTWGRPGWDVSAG